MDIYKSQEPFNDIFRYQVENNGNRNKISRNEFWKDLYYSKPENNNRFKSFVESDSLLLFITGVVGSGKSTFIRSMFEIEKLCTGIVIDFEGHASEFNKDNDIEIEAAIKNILKKALLSLLRENNKYRIIKGLNEFLDLHYDPNISIGEINLNTWENPIVENQALKELASDCILNLQAFPDIASLTALAQISFKGVTEELKESIKLKLESDGDFFSKTINSLDFHKLLSLYRLFSNAEKPFVICFDNIDAIKFSRIQSHFLEVIINITNSVNNSQSDGNIAKLNRQPIKAILTVRDENISRLNLSAAGTSRSMQIMLNKNSHEIAYVNTKITLQQLDFYQIVSRRLDKISAKYFDNEYITSVILLIKSHILDLENNKLRSGGDEFINISELSNESIRIMLDMISDLAFSLLELSISHNLESSALPKINQLVKAKLIHFLFTLDSTKSVMSRIVDSFKDELASKNVCCSFRLSLTTLYNCNGKASSFREMNNDFNSYFAIDELKLKTTLFNLFNTGNRESEIISIYQNEIILNENSIQDNSLIKINLKGCNIIDDIFSHLDFYGKITERSHRFYDKCLFELPPEQAIIYLNEIIKYIEETSISHKNTIKNILIPNSTKLLGKSNFNKYATRFCIKNSLFLRRTCDIHANYIKLYLNQLIIGDEFCFFVDKESKKILSKYRIDAVVKKSFYKDSEYREFFKNCDEKNTLEQFLGIINKYETITAEFSSLETEF